MGLTVSYRLAFRGTKTELLGKMQWLKGRFEELPVSSVGDVVDVRRAELQQGYGKYHGDRFLQNALGFMMSWSYFPSSAAEKACERITERAGGMAGIGSLPSRQRRRYDRLRREALAACGRRRDRIASCGNGVSLTVDVGEGCEHCHVMLGRLGNGRVWRGLRHTKTQYSTHFVDAHLAVISMLDLCREAGIVEKVLDDGDYWNTRNLEVLARNINASTNMIRAMSAAFGRIARARGWRTSSAVDRSANYVRVQESDQHGADRRPSSRRPPR